MLKHRNEVLGLAREGHVLGLDLGFVTLIIVNNTAIGNNVL